MKVRIEPDVYDSGNDWYLFPIFLHFLQDRHAWDCLDDSADAIFETEWFQQLKPSLKQDIQTLFKKQVYPEPVSSLPHSIKIAIDKSGNAPLKFTPSEAKRCLDEPLYVIVENAKSDRAFLEAMIFAFKRENVIRALQADWWKLSHAGGFGEIQERVEEIRWGNKKFTRVFVLADSDKEHPQHETDTMKKIEKYCLEQKVPFHILNKRKIENYLPVDILGLVPKSRRRTFNAFLHLSSEQRDFYEMKKGFKAKNGGQAEISENQQTLYQHVPRKIKNDLVGGFGPNIWHFFEKYRDKMTAEDVAAICPQDNDEISRLLDCVECMI